MDLVQRSCDSAFLGQGLRYCLTFDLVPGIFNQQFEPMDDVTSGSTFFLLTTQRDTVLSNSPPGQGVSRWTIGENGQ